MARVTKHDLWDAILEQCQELKIQPQVKKSALKEDLWGEFARVQKLKVERNLRERQHAQVKARYARYQELVGAKMSFFDAKWRVPEPTAYHDMLQRVAEDLVFRSHGLFKAAAAFYHFGQGAADLSKLIKAYREGEDIELDDLLDLVEGFLQQITTHGNYGAQNLGYGTSTWWAVERAREEKEKDNGSIDDDPGSD